MGTDCHNIEPKPLLRRIVEGVLTQDELCGVRHCIYDGNAPVIVVSILNVNLGAELYRILSTPQEWRRRGSRCWRHWRSCRSCSRGSGSRWLRGRRRFGSDGRDRSVRRDNPLGWCRRHSRHGCRGRHGCGSRRHDDPRGRRGSRRYCTDGCHVGRLCTAGQENYQESD